MDSDKKAKVEKLATLISESPTKAKEKFRELYQQLVQGEVWDWHHNDLHAFAQLLQTCGLKSEAEKLFLNFNSFVRRTAEEDYEYLIKDMPDYFAQKVDSGAILSRGEMKLLQNANKDAIFDRLFNHNTAYGIDILPAYVNSAMHELEDEFLKALQNAGDFREEDLPTLRKSLGERAKLIELRQHCKDFYTQKVRQENSAMHTCELEFKVSQASPIEGVRFMATRVCGYYGILRYYLEEVARVAPEGANAYLDGTAILRTSTFNGTHSPIIAGNILRPTNQPDDQYHIVPVKFFKVEVDKSRKYKGNWITKEEKKDGEGNLINKVMQYEVTPI